MTTTPIGWPEAQRICDILEVREALDKFAADAQEENMLAMVSAIMGHASAQGRAAGLEEAADPMPDCPRCNGSGEEEMMDGDGPDAHPIMVNCTHCGGAGSLSAAYKHLLAELATTNSKYLDACGKLYFADISPTPSDAGTDDALELDAKRYRWLRNESWAGYNQSKGKPQVFETVTMVLDGARNFKCILAEEAFDDAIDAAIAAQGERG